MMCILHALLMNYFEHRVFRTEPTAAVHGVRVDENRGVMFLVTQDAAHKGFFC